MLPALAHEFWIEPERFRPAAGQPLDVRLRVGQQFRGDTMIYLPQAFERFVTVSARGPQPVKGVAGDDPAARLQPSEPGPLWIAYQSTRYPLEFTAGEFEPYLEKEGLDAVRALRVQRGTLGKPTREVYSRCAKSLLAVGKHSEGMTVDRPLGLRLELVPLANPYALRPGAALDLQLLYEGRPLPGALVAVFAKSRPNQRITQRTDAQGRARISLPRADVWLVSAVHMIPAPPDANAEWESFWASLTFETTRAP